MTSPIQIIWRLSTAIALATVLAAFAVPGASARIVDDYFRDSTKPVLHTGGSIVDPAVRNRLVDDSFRDPASAATPAGGSGFGWSDLGIGGAALIGLVLGAGGATLVVRRRRTLAHAS